jgi:hypothetical protein
VGDDLSSNEETPCSDARTSPASRTGTVVKYDPERSVLGLEAGDPIRMRADDVERLGKAVLDELETRFVA